MDSVVEALKSELERFGKANDEAASERAARMLNITRDTGEFLSVLVRAAAARRVLEIGTSNGYSTLWLAEAARATGGHVLDSERAQYPDWWPQLARVLRPGGLLVVGNATSHAEQIAPFSAIVKADARFSTSLVPVGNGEFSR